MGYRGYIFPSIVSLATGSVLGVYIPNLIFITSTIIFLFSIIFVISLQKRTGTISLLSFQIIILCFGLNWGNIYSKNFTIDSLLQSNVGSLSTIEGVIDSNPTFKNGNQVFIIKINKTKVEVNISSIQRLEYGMKVSVNGKLEKPENFRITNGKEVDYEAMMRARGIELRLFGKRIEVLEENKGNVLLSNLYDFKNRIKNVISAIPKPESDLFFSMIFGGKSNLSNDLIENFKASGLLHIVVLSGQNLTIVSILLFAILALFFGFKISSALSLIFLFSYALIGGFEPATTRAFIMASIMILMRLMGRYSSSGRALIVSAMIMIILNPYILFDDPSFQLSCLAFLGIIYISPIVQVYLIKKNVNIKLADYVAAIFGAQAAVIPYIVYSSQSITPYAMFANFLVLFSISLIMIVGMIAVIVGLYAPSIFLIISFPVVLVIKYIISVSNLIANIPMSTIPINVSYYFVITIYLLIFIKLYKRWKEVDMSPLSQFILRDEMVTLSRGRIPYSD